jgi:hypothetical protein
MTCPECGEDAREQPPADLVNWQAHGIAEPGWSHRDGSALCPVIDPSGGYQPARPAPEPGTGDPPAVRQDRRGAERGQPGDLPGRRADFSAAQDWADQEYQASDDSAAAELDEPEWDSADSSAYIEREAGQ